VFGDGCTPGCHYFCEGCLRTWADTENTCPTCRTNFTRIVTDHGYILRRGIAPKRQRVDDDSALDMHSISVSEREWLSLVFGEMLRMSNAELSMESVDPEQLVLQARQGNARISFRLRRVRQRTDYIQATEAGSPGSLRTDEVPFDIQATEAGSPGFRLRRVRQRTDDIQATEAGSPGEE
jgi:hypothetical protein